MITNLASGGMNSKALSLAVTCPDRDRGQRGNRSGVMVSLQVSNPVRWQNKCGL